MQNLYQQTRRYPPSLGDPPPGPNTLPGAAQSSLQGYTAKNFYIYNVATTASLTAGNSTTVSFNVDGDSDFFWTKFNAFANDGNSGTTYSAQDLPGVTALITNTTSGRNYSSTAVPLPNYAGTAQFPFILPQMTFVPAKANIQIQLLNITAGTTYTVIHLSFIGIKAFK
jgi:hypothetical protein